VPTPQPTLFPTIAPTASPIPQAIIIKDDILIVGLEGITYNNTIRFPKRTRLSVLRNSTIHVEGCVEIEEEIDVEVNDAVKGEYQSNHPWLIFHDECKFEEEKVNVYAPHLKECEQEGDITIEKVGDNRKAAYLLFEKKDCSNKNVIIASVCAAIFVVLLLGIILILKLVPGLRRKLLWQIHGKSKKKKVEQWRKKAAML